MDIKNLQLPAEFELTTNQAAEITGVALGRIQQWAAQGKIPAKRTVKSGGKWAQWKILYGDLPKIVAVNEATRAMPGNNWSKLSDRIEDLENRLTDAYEKIEALTSHEYDQDTKIAGLVELIDGVTAPTSDTDAHEALRGDLQRQ